RLNVAITRAKEKIYIISSFAPSDLKVENSKNEGPRLFKKYLEYAKSVSDGHYQPVSNHEPENSASWYLNAKIAEIIERNDQLYTLTEELPFSDLTVKNADQYKSLIMTDDQLYHQAISIKDPHVYTPFILKHKNWKFRGFFSREYWNNKELLEEKIMIFLGQE